MKLYILKRLFHSIFVLVGISVVVFVILHLTGDPAALMMPMDATPEQVAQFRKEMGFTDPLPVQYWRFFKGTLRGDFGNSFRHSQPALGLVLERMPATIQLTFAALIIALAIAIPAGIVSAIRRNSILDHIGMTGALLGQSMPVFWLGVMLILIFSVTLQWFPSSGRGGIQHLILPAVTLGMFSMARTARVMRSSMLEVLGKEYMTTAKAKGLAPQVVILEARFEERRDSCSHGRRHGIRDTFGRRRDHGDHLCLARGRPVSHSGHSQPGLPCSPGSRLCFGLHFRPDQSAG